MRLPWDINRFKPNTVQLARAEPSNPGGALGSPQAGVSKVWGRKLLTELYWI